MPNNRDFEGLELVSYEGEVYAVTLIDMRKGLLGITAEAKCQSAEDWDFEQYSHVHWCPLRQAEKLRPVPVDSATVRSFFRLEKTVWELARSGKYPFTAKAALVPTTDDITAALAQLLRTDCASFYHWRTLFISTDRCIKPHRMDEIPRLLYALLKSGLDDDWDYFSEQEKQHSLRILADNATLSLRDWHVDDDSAYTVFRTVEGMAKEHPISADLRDLYVRVLDAEPSDDQHLEWRTEHRAYAYYGGNAVVPCNWHKAEQALLKAYNLSSVPFRRMRFANSLGYIYYSKRLGAPDYAKAFRYFSEASESGSIEASYKLADMYRLGHGTPPDGEKALSMLKPLYDLELSRHQRGKYDNKLADVALRLGYCARDGVGREQSLREAYRYFRLAENAIAIRLTKYNHFGDSHVRSSVQRALADISQVYSPDSESYEGFVGTVSGTQALARCLQDGNETILIRSLDASHAEQRVPRKSFTPLADNIRDVGEQVTLRQNRRHAVIRDISWHYNRGAAIYYLTIDGKNSAKWHFESDFATANERAQEVDTEDEPLFYFGEPVRHAGKLYVAVGTGYLYLDRLLQVVPAESVCITPTDPDDDTDIEAQTIPLSEIEKLPPIQADHDTVQAFFRLDTTVLKLMQEGKFPFAENSAQIIPSADEIIDAVGRLLNADRLTFSQWCEQFLHNCHLIPIQQVEERARLLLSLLAEHTGYMPSLSTLYQQFTENAHRLLRDWVIDSLTEENLLLTAEEMAAEKAVSDDLRALYMRVLDNENNDNERNRAYRRGFAYYGGNQVVACDWHKAEKALLKAYAVNSFDEKGAAANALGYIYYHGRLGAPDYDQAFRFFSEAAASGEKEARYKLSDLHRLGYGTPVDGAKALELLKPLYRKELKRYKHKHYDAKLADVALRLGYCARDGVGMEQNLPEAYRYFQQAQEAIVLRRKHSDQYGDEVVEANINRALEELKKVYAPQSSAST